MKKTIPIILALIVVAGLAFYMGRQSAPTPVVENPPAESSAPEVKETPEAESTSEIEVTPEPDNSGNEKIPSTNANESINQEFEAILGIGNIELFESSIGTVYATENVHMRENFNADSNSKGVLAKGQSITRLAIGKEDEAAEGWSKAVLSDGTIVYIKSEYLSTSRVASGSGNGNNSGNNVEAIPNKESDEKPTSNPPVNKPESSGPDPNQNDENTNIPENPSHVNQLTWEELGDNQWTDVDQNGGGNSDKPIDNSHLKNNG